MLSLPVKKERIIYCFVVNDLVEDARAHRTCLAIQEAGYTPVLIGRELPTSLPVSRTYEIRRWSYPINKGIGFYFLMNLRIMFFLLIAPSYVYALANDADTLPGICIAAKIRRKKIIFDAHEWFSEVPELAHRKIVKKIWKLIEKFFIPRVDFAVTVNEALANIFTKKFGKQFHVIRNVPEYNPAQDSGPYFPTKKLIYIGAINKDRGIELMLHTMKLLPDFHLQIVGSGDLMHSCQQMARTLGISNVTFTGRVPFYEVMNFARNACLGLSFEEDSCGNYHYALPNKWFTYVHAGIPVLVSNLPLLAEYTRKYKVGEILTSRNPEAIARQIRQLLSPSNALYPKYVQACRKAAEILCWQKEKKIWIRLLKHE